MKDKKKNFDCVKMKDTIQKKILQKTKGVSAAAERNSITRGLQTSSSSVAEWWRQLKKKSQHFVGV